MKYKFPIIRTIDDVLPAIKDRVEFIVAGKEHFTVICYVVNMPDTFTGEHEAIRRECRGLIFDRQGILISRPLHKFFNINEKPETQIQNIDLSFDHHVLDKLDGSMVRPVYISEWDGFRFATKMGISDVAMDAEVFVAQNLKYLDFCHQMRQFNLTPIFEWLDPKKPIVIKYDQPSLIVTAIREMTTGEYCTYEQIKSYCVPMDIPYVKSFSSISNIDEFLDKVKDEKDIEGYVMRFNTGAMVKFKTEEYVLLHKSKETTEKPRLIVKAILEDKVDDLKAFLSETDRKKVEGIENVFWFTVGRRAEEITLKSLEMRKKYPTRKDFAMGEKNLDPMIKKMIFQLWDGKSDIAIIKEEIMKHCQVDIRFREFVNTNKILLAEDFPDA